MPPYRLLAAYFLCGFAWLAFGAAGVVLVAGDLAQGHVLGPRAVAVTHAFTLGWVTTLVFGTLLQIFPGALGIGARSVRAGWLTLALLQAGAAAMVAAAWRWSAPGMAAGSVILFWAVFAMGWNLLPQRRQAPRGLAIGRYVAAAHVGLGLAVFAGMARIGDALGWWAVPRMGVLVAHAHLAGLGFATLSVVGVGSKMLPLFLGSRGFAEWPLRWIGPVLGGGLVVLAAGALLGRQWLALPGGLATAAGCALFLYQAWSYFATRAPRPLGPDLALVAASLVLLGAAVPLGLALLARDVMQLQLMAAYGLLGVTGWLALVACGISLRIVPALTWSHRFGARSVTVPGAPTAAALSLPWLGWVAALLLPAGVAATAFAVARGHAGGARGAAVVFAAGVLAYLAHQLRAMTYGRGAGGRPPRITKPRARL